MVQNKWARRAMVIHAVNGNAPKANGRRNLDHVAMVYAIRLEYRAGERA